MKKIILNSLLVFLLIFTACQDENETITLDASSFLKDSNIASLLLRTTQNSTGFDDILDGTNCFSVVLPVTITVNSQQILISTSSDYQLVKNAINAYPNDDDDVFFSFPIVIKFRNFQTQTISDINQYNAILANCNEDSEFDEIDCISINYPITLNVYNSSNQVSNSIAFANNIQLYNYIENLLTSTYVAISYPITLQIPNGESLVITSNDQLTNTIESFIEECDDDISIDPTPTLTEVLTSGTWYVSYCYRNSINKTVYYNGYNFTFNPNGTSIAINNATTITGTWYSYLDDNEIELELTFQGNSLDDIEEDWKLIEYTTSVIKLKHGNSNIDYLTITKN
jgi:hypothetical protein